MSETVNFTKEPPKQYLGTTTTHRYGKIPSSYQFNLDGKLATHLVASNGVLFATNWHEKICLATYDKRKSPLFGTISSVWDKATLVLTDGNDLTWIKLAPYLEKNSYGPEAFSLPWQR